MKSFRSILLLRTETKKDLKLAECAKVHAINSPFTVHSDMKHLFLFNNQLEVHSVAPFNLLTKMDYQRDVVSLLAAGERLFVLTNDSLIMHENSQLAHSNGSFQGGSLVRIVYAPDAADSSLEEKEGVIAVQMPHELYVFNKHLSLLATWRCQCAFSTPDFFVTADLNVLEIRSTKIPKTKIMLPDNAVSLACDSLLSAIYVSLGDGGIYRISLTGDEPTTLAYHSEPVHWMAFSICGRYLFSADRRKACVWDTASLCLVDFLETPEDIHGLEVVVEGNRHYKEIPVKL